LRVVETLVNLLVGIVSDTAEVAIAPQFKPVKSLLEVARNHLVTPFNGRIFPVAVLSAPFFVPCSADFPARCVNNAPLHKEWNLVVFNAPVYAQRRGDTRA
jgi:hypothetical protein